MGRVFKADIRRETTCPSCATGYYYFDEVEVHEGGGDFDAAIRKKVENGVDVVPCPSCKKLSPAMRKQHWIDLAAFIVGLIASLGTAGVIMGIFESGGVIMIGLLVLALLGALACAVLIVVWPFSPMMNRDRAVIPGQEDQASEAVKAKIETWQANRDQATLV
ncbi:hypothetical protein [uncultured Maricaulis sp.]|uniref:hypothetical protein n=1 Tax=uncultured Maricaulis sp. TaxID=174710 RepID=UPI0030DB9E6F|tara:strand:- start:109558 stop:110046 length:489 start_codon:yes stop_codon:yes gene_type:complete